MSTMQKVCGLTSSSNLKGLYSKLSHLGLETWNLTKSANVKVVPLLLETSLAHFPRCCFSFLLRNGGEEEE